MKSACSFFLPSHFQLAKQRGAGKGRQRGVHLLGRAGSLLFPGHEGNPFPSPIHTQPRTAKGGEQGSACWKIGNQPRVFWAAGSNFSSFPRTSGWAEDQRSPIASAPAVLAARLPAGKELQALLCPASCAPPSPATAGGKPPAILRRPLAQPTRSPVHPDLINLLICS